MSDGDVPATANPEAVASFYVTVVNGMSIEARDGACFAELQRTVSGAMAAWDSLCAA